jgi:hypothetical protein
MENLGAWGTLIHEKNLKSKISCQTPFNSIFLGRKEKAEACTCAGMLGWLEPARLPPFRLLPVLERLPRLPLLVLQLLLALRRQLQVPLLVPLLQGPQMKTGR